jgi:hypothetical protein
MLFHMSRLDEFDYLLRQRRADAGDRGQGLEAAFFIGLFDINGVISKDLRGLPVGQYFEWKIALRGKCVGHLGEHVTDDLIRTQRFVVVRYHYGLAPWEARTSVPHLFNKKYECGDVALNFNKNIIVVIPRSGTVYGTAARTYH